LVPTYIKLENKTRETIDKKLEAAGWAVQVKQQLNLYAKLGVAVREMDTDTGPADYMLFVNGKACGIIEAKREGKNIGGVAEQSQRYATSIFKHIKPSKIACLKTSFRNAQANGCPKPSSLPKTMITLNASSIPCVKCLLRPMPSVKQSPTKSAKKSQKTPLQNFVPARNCASASP
jgi:hypothetical protein